MLSWMAPQFTGGLRRLWDQGACFPDCRHLASTFPSTTIATLATGAWPAQHGIVADYWYDRSLRKAVRASDEHLMATTLAAQVAAEDHARVYVCSLDRKEAALYAGSSRARTFWMDSSGQFVAAGEWPDWLTDFNRLKPVENVHNAAWMSLGARPGAPPLRVLKYEAAQPQQFLALYKASPLGQEAQFSFAAELAARERLGQGSGPDFLCLLNASSALLGYETGGRSPLMQQLLLRLDQHLEYLMTALDSAPGAGNYSLVLAGAHGAPPAPPPGARARMAVNGESLAQSVDRALLAVSSGRVERYLYPFLYLDTSGFREPEPVRLAAARAALQYPAVAGYYTAGGACSIADGWDVRFRNSFHPKRSGDVMLSYQPEYIEDYGKNGVSYGSLYNYDCCVPLFFYGPQFRAGTWDSPVQSIDVAPTLARAMGVALPSSCSGRVLSRAFGGDEA
jgi:hypothetical protein